MTRIAREIDSYWKKRLSKISYKQHQQGKRSYTKSLKRALNLGDDRSRPYLKMKNPSIATYHLEGVAPEIRTVQEALDWRNQTKIRPEVLT